MNAVSQETAQQAAHRLMHLAIQGVFAVEALHVYRNQDGRSVFWRLRARKANGEKVIRPMHWNGSAYVAGLPSEPADRGLLYRLPELLVAEPSAAVLIVEGEWCADHLYRMGLTATTSGSSTSTSGADWTPLRGRRCLLWPDNDEPGRKYMNEVSNRLHALGCVVDLIDVTALKLVKKGDCVDWLRANPDATAADVLSLPTVRPLDTEGLDISPRVILTRGDTVQPVAVDWLWNGWLAAGKLHLIGGAPGTGKTTIAATLAAAITRGGLWPDGAQAARGSVVFWSGEDDIADTLAPRLRAAGADMQRTHIIEGVNEGADRYAFDPARDMDALRASLATIPDVRLIVLDPIVSAVAGDSHRNAEVRRGLQPLVDLAGQLRCALLGVTHFSKGTAGRDPVERITGSLAFGAVARLDMVTVKREAEGDRPERRAMLRAKSNIGPDGGGFVYDLQQGELSDYLGVSASFIQWGEWIDGTARELLAEAEQRDDDQGATSLAVEFLHASLALGARSVKDLKIEADAAGIAWRTLERAKRKAGVAARKNGMNGGWDWYKAARPEDRHEDREARQPLKVAAFGGLQETEAASEGDMGMGGFTL